MLAVEPSFGILENKTPFSEVARTLPVEWSPGRETGLSALSELIGLSGRVDPSCLGVVLDPL